MKMIDILLNEHHIFHKMYNRMYLHYFSIDVEYSAEVKSQFYDAVFYSFFDRPNIFFFFFLAYKGIQFVYIEMTEDE